MQFYDVTSYKQFQTDSPTYIIRELREMPGSERTSSSLESIPWQWLDKAGGILDPALECYDVAFSLYSGQYSTQ